MSTQQIHPPAQPQQPNQPGQPIQSTPPTQPHGHGLRARIADLRTHTADYYVPVHTKRWCTWVMVPLASFMALAQTSYTAQGVDETSPMYAWLVFSTLVAIASGFVLLARNRHPEITFVIACALVLIFPFDSLVVLMALTALLARRNNKQLTIGAIVIGTVLTLYSQLRDVLHKPEASLWYTLFADPHTGREGEPPLHISVEPAVVVITAVIVALVASLIAVLVGLHIRSKATLEHASARIDATVGHAASLQDDLNNQQLADMIAAGAHDTLAHSLSLLALNASALQTQASHLSKSMNTALAETITETSEAINGVVDASNAHALEHSLIEWRAETDSLATTARDIRRQAAGALDEAHSIINMLRHPEQAQLQLAPSDETSLTRESLETLIADARAAGMRIDTWIDIQQLSSLDEHISKTSYRAIQEGLTNARRHANGMPVSLQVDANPQHGIHIHVSNPTNAAAPVTYASPAVAPASVNASASSVITSPNAASTSASAALPQDRTGGNGLRGLMQRVQREHGICKYGYDEHNTFHLDVRLPWIDKPVPNDEAHE